MEFTPTIERDLIQSLADFAWDKAPEHIPDLYLGLDYESVEEVVTDALGHIFETFTLPDTPDHTVAMNCDSAIRLAERYASSLLRILPSCVQEVRKRVAKEVSYEMKHFSYGLTPFENTDEIDRTSPLYTGDPLPRAL